MDGIMVEASPFAVGYMQYLGLTRPMILFVIDTTGPATETKDKTAVYSGFFPSLECDRNDSMSRIIDRKYQPLIDLSKGKKWVLNAHALRLPVGTKGNIFKKNDNDLLISMVSMNRSQIFPWNPFIYNLQVIPNVPGLGTYDHCYLLSGDYLGTRWIDYYPPISAPIIIPEHMVSSLIQLSTEPCYEYAEISSPVLRKGMLHSFQLRVQNIDYPGTKHYNICLETPFGDNFYDFYLNSLEIYNLQYNFSIPPDSPEKEDTFRVIEQEAQPPDTTLFTVWVVSDLSMHLPAKLFVKFPVADTFPLTLVNNTESALSVTLTAALVTGHGTATIIGPNPVSLQALEHKELQVRVEPKDISDTLQLTAVAGGNTAGSIKRPVERAMRPTPGDIFSDDFHSGNMNQWNRWEHPDAWTVENYRAKGLGSHGWHFATIAAGDVNWANYRYQMNTMIEGSTVKPWLKSYLFFRVQDNQNYYRFGIHGPNNITLYKRINGAWTLLASIPFTAEKNIWYNLAVEVNGSSIKCYLNGELVIEKTDYAFDNGGIGIGVLEDNMTVYYDEIVVRPLTPPTILFADNFDSGNPDALWNIRLGNWEVITGIDETFWRGSGSAHFATVAEDCDWTNFTYQVRTRIQGSLTVAYLKSYIFFRVQDDQNYYRFGIHGDQNCIDLYKRVYGNWIPLASSAFIPVKNVWYNLKITIQSNHIYGYRDEAPIIDYIDNDNPFLNGGIGIGVLEDDMVTDYDNVKVEP